MTQIITNRIRVIDVDIEGMSSVYFDYLGDSVYAATRIQRLFGVFVSNLVEASEGMVRWRFLNFQARKTEGTDIYVYIRTASSTSALESASWTGPFINPINDISLIEGRFLQFMVVLINDAQTFHPGYQSAAGYPILDELSLSYLSSENASYFFTKTFSLGFVPKHVLVTYNADEDPDSVIRFWINGTGSTAFADYRLIDSNKIEDVSDMSVVSTQLKIMVQMIGTSGVPLKLHEFALMFSGKDVAYLNVGTNTIYLSSSSSSSLSSSSSSSSSSSELAHYHVYGVTNPIWFNGRYYDDGEFNGHPSYIHDEDETGTRGFRDFDESDSSEVNHSYVFWDIVLSAWIIATAKATPSTDWFQRSDLNITGDYVNHGAYTGTTYVDETAGNTSSSSSLSSSSSSSSSTSSSESVGNTSSSSSSLSSLSSPSSSFSSRSSLSSSSSTSSLSTGSSLSSMSSASSSTSSSSSSSSFGTSSSLSSSSSSSSSSTSSSSSSSSSTSSSSFRISSSSSSSSSSLSSSSSSSLSSSMSSSSSSLGTSSSESGESTSESSESSVSSSNSSG